MPKRRDGMLPLLLVAGLGVWVLLPQVRADIETQHQGLARAISGQVEAHLLGAGRELSALAAYLGQRGGSRRRSGTTRSTPMPEPAMSLPPSTSLPWTTRCMPSACRSHCAGSATIC
jgi:hypothetical protein